MEKIRNYTTQFEVLKATPSLMVAAVAPLKAKVSKSQTIAVTYAPVLECTNPSCKTPFGAVNVARNISATGGAHVRYCDACKMPLPILLFTTPSTLPHKELARLIEQTSETDARDMFSLVKESFADKYLKAGPRQLKSLVTYPAKGKEPGASPLDGYVLLDGGTTFSWNFLTSNLSMENIFSLNDKMMGIPWCYQVESALSVDGKPDNYLRKIRPPGLHPGKLEDVKTIVIQRSTIEL